MKETAAPKEEIILYLYFGEYELPFSPQVKNLIWQICIIGNDILKRIGWGSQFSLSWFLGGP